MIKLSQHISRIKSSPAQLFFWGVLSLFALAHIIIYVVMPYTCDDYWYMTPLADYCKGVDASFPGDALLNCWYDHYTTDNIRLSNVVFTLTLLLPKFIPSFLSGLLVGVTLWLSAKLTNISWRNPLLFILLAFGLSFALPWYEEMFTQCFALNYVWATALALMLALRFWSNKKQNIYISLFLGILVGIWHEGFAVPLLAGFVSYLILNRNEINRQRIVIVGAVLVGLLWLMSAPGLQANVGYKTNELQLSTTLSKLLLYHAPLFILALSILFAANKNNTRKLIFDSKFVSFVIICLVGVALNLVTNVGVRTGWMGYLFGIIATLYLWKNMKKQRYSYGKSVLKRVLTILISLFLLTHYIVVVYYSVKVRDEVDCVLERYHESSDGLVFADVTYDYQVSPLAWKKPYFEIFTYDWVMYWNDMYFNNGTKQLRVIPTCLENSEYLQAEKVKGDNPFYIYNGYLFAPVAECGVLDKDLFFEIDFGLTKKVLRCSNFKYTTSQGGEYYFSFPQRSTVHRWFGKIREINAVKI